MQVIRVEEENHGVICIAADYKSAIAFLINEGWLFDEAPVYHWNTWKTVRIVYGDNWRNVIMNEWGINHFNEVFDGYLYLRKKTVYDIKEGEEK